MDTLRTPLFLVAVVLILLVVGLEIGASWLPGTKVSTDTLLGLADAELRKDPDFKDEDDRNDALTEMRDDLEKKSGNKPPGIGAPYLALLDGLVLYTALLMGLSLLLPESFHGRVQGIVTLIVSLLALIADFVLFFGALGLLLVMVGLFVAAPFGTIAYLAVWGFFDRAGASAVLTLGMTLKLCFAFCLVFAHPRFLQNKGLVLLVLTSLLATVIVTFLHGLVPVILVSITDAVAALVVVVLAAIWAVFLLVGAVISIAKAIA